MKRNVLVLFCALMALSLVACQAERPLSNTDFTSGSVFSGSDSDDLSPEKVVATSTGSTTPFIDPLLGPVGDVVLADGVPPLPKALQKKAKGAAQQIPVKDTAVPLAPPTALPPAALPPAALPPAALPPTGRPRIVTPTAPAPRGRVIIDPNGPQVGDVVEVRDVATGTSTRIGTGTAMPRVIVNPNGPQVGDVVEVRDLGVAGPLPMPLPMPEDGDTAAPAGGDMASDLANETRIEADKRAFMVSSFVKKGREALADGDLSAARDYFGRALQLDPGNADAQKELNRISDSRPATVTDFVDERVEATRVRRQKAAAEVRNHVDRARNLENQERYEDARKEYQKALAILTWYDETEDFGITAPRLRDLIQNNKFRATDAARLRKSEALRAASQEQTNVLEGERMRRLGRVRGYFSAANSAFRQQNYALSREYANQVLREDPGNADAEMLIRISYDAEHMNNTRESRLNFDNEWKKVMKEVEYKSLPQVQTVEFPDDWLDEIAHRTPRLVGDADEDGEEEGIAGIVSVLRTKRVKGLDWQEATLDDAVAYLRTITGLNFVVSQRARDEQGESVSISLQLDDVTVDTILDLITSQNGLKWIPQDGVIKIALPDEVSGTMKLRFFDVKDLDTRIQDFVGQEINLTPSNFTPPDAPELDDPQPLFPAENLPDLIQQTIGGEGDWDEPAGIDIKAGVLIVRNTKKILNDIGALLDDLRANTGILVNLEVRFLTAEDNFLRDVGVDVRGLGDNSQGIGAPGLGSNVTQDDVFFGIPAQGTNPEPSSVGRTNDAGIFYSDGQDGAYAARVENLFDTLLGNPGVLTGSGGLSLQHTFLDDTQMEVILRAVEKSERVQQISAPRLTVYNTQRANVQVLNQVAYVADYEVEIAQASNIANPVVQTILDGIVLDVRPVVSANRRFVSLELRPTVAILTRPIATFSTSLASGPIGANAPVIIQLPQLRVSRVRTTVNMPDQGTLLLGGLIFYEQERLESGIPLLSKLPILSFLLSRKGNYVNRRNLMVLIRAEIVDLAEREPQDNRNVPELPADEDYLPVIESAPCDIPAAAARAIAAPSPCDPCAGR